MNVVAPVTYLGPISYYASLAKAEKILFEKKEHFIKQSYRNRCEIVGATGVLSLSIPTYRKGRDKTIIDKVKISYDSNWQAIHWRSLCTAYRSSPYFEYYEADFEEVFLKEYEYLFDFCFDLTKLILKKLNIDTAYEMTEKFQLEYDSEDLRPYMYKKNIKAIDIPRYIQVFEDRVPFESNLSIVDLLFNQGPAAASYLKSIA